MKARSFLWVNRQCVVGVMIGSAYILCRKDLWNSFYASEYSNTKSKGVKSMSPYERYLEMDK